jgi:hypothetical protein
MALGALEKRTRDLAYPEVRRVIFTKRIATPAPVPGETGNPWKPVALVAAGLFTD